MHGTRPPIIDHPKSRPNAGHAAGVWSIDDARFAAVFLFNSMHGIIDDAHLKETQVRRGRLIDRTRRTCFWTVGWPSDDDFDAGAASSARADGHR